jgi:GH15 family glucan-1,4-alpha-glucosidase
MNDFYYPHVGQENHTAFQNPHKVGVFTDNQFSWFEDHGWIFNPNYHAGTMTGNSWAQNNHLQLKLNFEDYVYTTHNILFRKVTIHNDTDREREIRLFFAHDFYLYGDKIQDTAQYEPDLNAVLHYRKKRYLLVNGRWENSIKGLDQYAVGKSSYGDKEGTWRDAEDGELGGNSIEQGSVDSCVRFSEYFQPGESKTLFFWIAAGKCYHDISQNNQRVLDMTPQKIYDHTFGYWREWGQRHEFEPKGLSAKTKDLFNRSLLTIRSQIDNRGAIIASNDSDIMKFNKDTYTYMWPRDGALVSLTLSRMGYFETVRNFLFFCEKIITEDGYVLHKYTPDGSLGSSWHAKFKDGKAQLPIQEDESALILVALGEFYKHSRSIEVVQKLFNSVVLKIGRWLVNFVDKKTGLPLPTHDLWEEQHGVFSYTAACTYAGLEAAANLSKCTGHYHDEKVFRTAARKMQKAIIDHLFCPKSNRFLKKLLLQNDEKVCGGDSTVDASISFVWELGVLPPDHPKIMSTMQAIEEQLQVKTEVGGTARYTGDYYHRNYDHQYSADVPGNPWIITTLWVANWKIALAKTRKDLQAPKNLINWAVSKASPAGILPEQIDPFTNEPLSVAPLTWSHSTFVDTIRRFSEKYESVK